MKPLYYWKILLLLCCACTPQVNQPSELSFYFWQTRLDLSADEKTYLDNLGSQRIYLRFFDVDWDGQQAIPLAILEASDTLPAHLGIVPTVFITNRTMVAATDVQVEKLVEQMAHKIEQMCQALFPKNKALEIQIDCDWSGKSKANYFQLLTLLRAHFRSINIPISSTLRLHQVKYYRETGVPPVDRVTLMYYNMGDVDQPEETNSILNLEVAQQYHENFANYPLPMDLALPLFSWGVVFRDDRLVKLINGLQAPMLADTTRFYKIAEKEFRLRKSTYLDGYYLYEQDRIRLEGVDRELLENAAAAIGKQFREPPANILFYHLDSSIVNQFEYEILQGIRDHFN